MTRPHCIGGLVWRWRPAPARDVPCPQCAAAIAMALFGWLLAACCPLAPMRPEPIEPRSVAEAVGMAELALAPMAVSCGHPGDPTATTWCRSYAGDELAEVMLRWGPAAVVGVAAHERGHALGYAPEGLRLTGEAMADAWAGCALARTELDVAPYLAVIAGLDAADFRDRREATFAGVNACKEKGP